MEQPLGTTKIYEVRINGVYIGMFTEDAYIEARLRMSPEDFHAHTFVSYFVDTDDIDSDVFTLEDFKYID